MTASSVGVLHRRRFGELDPSLIRAIARKLVEESVELQMAWIDLEQSDVEHELGDVMFMCHVIADRLHLDADRALIDAIERNRYKWAEP